MLTQVFAEYRESGRIIKGIDERYRVKTFVHGVQIDDPGAPDEIKTTFEAVPVSEEDVQSVETNIPDLPPVNTWVNLRIWVLRGRQDR